MAKILVIHGPNLNMLGQREEGLYGQDTLVIINERLQKKATEQGHQLFSFQSNAEFALIDKIHSANQIIDYIIFNPAAFTHTSIALRDALLAVKILFIEVHISNIFQREPFRQNSYFSDIAQGVISGLGSYGYDMALQSIFYTIHQQERT